MAPLLLLFACAPAPLQATVEQDASGLVVRANQPLSQVRVLQQGELLAVVQPGTAEVAVRAPVGDSPVQIEVEAGVQHRSIEFVPAVRGPYQAWLEAPLGQGRIEAGNSVERGVRGGLVVQAEQDVQLSWRAPEVGGARLAAGERVVVPFVVSGDVAIQVEGAGVRRTLRAPAVDPSPVPLSMEVRFPVDASGRPDPTAPQDRIRLPAPWWDGVLDRFGLGFRPRSDQAPIGLLGVDVRNPSDRTVNAVVTARFTHPAFRPRLRDQAHQDRVSRLVRLHPGQTRASLPVYLDRAALRSTTIAPVELELRLLGAAGAPQTQTYELVVERGSRWASAVAGVGLVAATLGWVLLGVRGRRWLQRPTPELTTIAMFGALTFSVGVASQVLGLGIGTVLGPFAPFAIGLFDDAVRMCLAATLLMLVPRVGVASVALLVGWLMRAVVLGAAHPVDLLYLGSAIATQESALWVSGVTRGAASSWGRLVVGLALPHAFSALLSLAVSSVVYRLYYAEWYVVAIVLVPGLFYAMLGCALAVPFARRVR